jgi:hypothetical protein
LIRGVLPIASTTSLSILMRCKILIGLLEDFKATLVEGRRRYKGA